MPGDSHASAPKCCWYSPIRLPVARPLVAYRKVSRQQSLHGADIRWCPIRRRTLWCSAKAPTAPSCQSGWHAPLASSGCGSTPLVRFHNAPARQRKARQRSVKMVMAAERLRCAASRAMRAVCARQAAECDNSRGATRRSTRRASEHRTWESH